jgi:glycosyltransferase involved in cell wall biosynthesis
MAPRLTAPAPTERRPQRRAPTQRPGADGAAPTEARAGDDSAARSAQPAHADPLRVGLVIGQLSLGGAEGQLRLLCERLDRVGVRAFVYCLSAQTEPYGALLHAAGVPVRVIVGSRIRRAVQLRRLLRADRVDLVHAWLFIANAYGWTAQLGRHFPLITSARNCKRQGRWLDALNRRAFAASAAVIVNSRQVQRYIEREYGAPPGRIVVIPNAIDLERFRPQPRPPGSRTVVMVGRLVQQKNPLLFVAAAAALHARMPDTRFVLVGDGPLRGRIQAAVDAAGLGAACTLAGERDDVQALLRQADLFWLTSDWEGLPNAVIEALACGLPVVATHVGGAGDLLEDGCEGFLVAPGDRDALVARSLEIFSDPALQARMRAAARARAEGFGIDAMVRATQAVYARALAGRAA